MRKILRFAKREYLAAVKTKGFIIMLVLMPVLMGGSGIAMYLFRNQVDTTDKKVAVIDRSGVVAQAIISAAEKRNEAEVYDKKTGKKMRPAYVFESVVPNDQDPLTQCLELSDRIRREELHGFLEIGPNVLHLVGEKDTFHIAYHARNAAVDNVRNWLNSPINTHLRKTRLIEAGIAASETDGFLTWINVDALGLVSVDEETGEVKDAERVSEAQAILVPVILFLFMFMMVMMGAMPLLQSTAEEKQQRIAEVLLGSLKPVEFMAGKILGGLGVSLTGASVYVIGGLILLNKIGLAEVIPFYIIPWFFTFLVLEIVMMGSLLAALGSACNDPKDAQNMMFPAMFPVFFPMFIFMPVLQEPTSALATWLSLFPPFTPLLMLIRKSSSVLIPAWQPWVGLAGVILFTIFTIWAGGRIFRVGIMMQGGPPKFSKMIKWVVKG